MQECKLLDLGKLDPSLVKKVEDAIPQGFADDLAQSITSKLIDSLFKQVQSRTCMNRQERVHCPVCRLRD